MKDGLAIEEWLRIREVDRMLERSLYAPPQYRQVIHNPPREEQRGFVTVYIFSEAECID